MSYQLGIPAALQRFGVRVREVNGWQTRGGSTFAPAGVVDHHDAFRSTITAQAAVALMVHGRSDLPGPLCNVWLDDNDDYTTVEGDPIAYVIAAGRANHAGAGSWLGLVGNRTVFGVEARNAGTGEPWSPMMVDAYDRTNAALLWLMQRDARWLCGHKEWAPTRKIDPRGLDMNGMRARAHGLIGGTPAQPPPVQGPVGPTLPASRLSALMMEDDMPGCFTTNPHNTAEVWWWTPAGKRYVGHPDTIATAKLACALQGGNADMLGPGGKPISAAAFDEVPTIA